MPTDAVSGGQSPTLTPQELNTLANTISQGTGGTVSIDQVKRDLILYENEANTLGTSITLPLKYLVNLSPNKPGLPYPGLVNNLYTKDALGNAWLAPDGMVALLSALLEFQSQQKLNELQEGLNGAKTMMNNVKMGKELAALEIAKGWREFGSELAQGLTAVLSAVSMGVGLAGRARAISKSGGESLAAKDPQYQQLSKNLETLQGANAPRRQAIEAANNPGTDASGRPLAGPSDATKAANKAELDKMNGEEGALKSKKEERIGAIQERAQQTYQMQAQMAQQMFQAAGHFVSAWMKLDVAQIDASKAMLHAAQDINKQMMQKHGEYQSGYQQGVESLSRMMESLKAAQSQQIKTSHTSA